MQGHQIGRAGKSIQKRGGPLFLPSSFSVNVCAHEVEVCAEADVIADVITARLLSHFPNIMFFEDSQNPVGTITCVLPVAARGIFCFTLGGQRRRDSRTTEAESLVVRCIGC